MGDVLVSHEVQQGGSHAASVRLAALEHGDRVVFKGDGSSRQEAEGEAWNSALTFLEDWLLKQIEVDVASSGDVSENGSDQVQLSNQSQQQEVLPGDLALGEADLSSFEKLGPSEWLTGEVIRVTSSGAVVMVSPPGSSLTCDGFVHMAEMNHGPGELATDVVSLGDMVQVRVKRVRVDVGKLFLSMKPSSLSAFQEFNPSEWVSGTVSQVSSHGLWVIVLAPDGETSFKGYMPLKNMKLDEEDVESTYHPGQEVEVRIVAVVASEDRMVLSMQDYVAPSLDASFEDVDTSTWMTGMVTSVSSEGAWVTVARPDGRSTRRGFAHVSEVVPHMAEDLDNVMWTGQEVRVRVCGVEAATSTLKLSMKDEAWMAKLAPFKGIDSARWLTGRVVRAGPSGAFVRVTAPGTDVSVDGFLPEHDVEYREEAEASLEDVVRPGQDVRVRVTKVRTSSGKLFLSMRASALKSFKGFDSSQWLHGKVTGMSQKGAWVQVTQPDTGETCSGFLRRSEIEHCTVEAVHNVVCKGEQVLVRVVGVDESEDELVLSMKDTALQSNIDAFKTFDSSRWHLGRVARVTTAGAYVTVRAPEADVFLDGFVPNCELEYIMRAEGESDSPQSGEDVYVRITRVSTSTGKLFLSMKATDPKPASGSSGCREELHANVAWASGSAALVELTEPCNSHNPSVLRPGVKLQLRLVGCGEPPLPARGLEAARQALRGAVLRGLATRLWPGRAATPRADVVEKAPAAVHHPQPAQPSSGGSLWL